MLPVPLIALLVTAAPQRVLVQDVASTPASAVAARHLTEELILALGHLPALVVIGEAELKVVLAHDADQRDLEACARGEECLAKLKAAVDAEKLLSSRLAAWGEGWLVTLAITDLKTASLERGESCQADTIEEVERCATRLAIGLFGGEVEAKETFHLGGRTKLAVIDLEAYGTDPDLARNLTQLLALELRKFDGVQVVGRDEVKAALAYESDKQVVQCVSDMACLIEIGGALGVEWLVLGAVGRLDETYVIHLKLLRAETAEVAQRIAESYRGPQQQLAQSIRFAAWRLMGKPMEGRGALAVETDVEAVSFAVDGGPPRPLAGAQLTAGKHSLALAAADYHRLSHEFYVEPDRTTTLHPELMPLPTPWYREWWPWAIIGSAVAAAVTTSVVLALDAPENGRLDFE